MTTPGWADELGRGVDPALVVAAVTAAATPGAPRRQRAAIAARLEDGRSTAAAELLADLLRSATSRPSAARIDAVAGRLLAHGARVLVVGEPGYPPRLAHAWPELGAPLWLFARGRVAADDAVLRTAHAVAVVGTRHPTLHGRAVARQLAAFLGERRAVVVSGMARGIDQAAHRGALDVDGGTVAVLGAGFGVDYPRGAGTLHDAVADSGAVITEYLPGVEPRADHFLWRNRVLSGLSDVLVMVQGRRRSGALQTARLAAAQGRDVFAVAGSPLDPISDGPLALIRDGARVLTSFYDVLPTATPGREQRARERPFLRGTAAAVLELLSSVPASVADLTAGVGQPVAAVLAAITELEGAGLAVVSPHGVVAAPPASAPGAAADVRSPAGRPRRP